MLSNLKLGFPKRRSCAPLTLPSAFRLHLFTLPPRGGRKTQTRAHNRVKHACTLLLMCVGGCVGPLPGQDKGQE